MNNEISLILPTRGRPDSFLRMVTSALETADFPNDISIFAYVDRDDETLDKYLEIEKKFGGQIKLVVGERILLSETNNILCEMTGDSCLVGMLGDDIIFRTPGWSSILLKAKAQFLDGVCLIFCPDGYNTEISTHPFISREWIQASGKLVWGHFSADFSDTFLSEVARLINRTIKVPEVYLEHMHFAANKGVIDGTMMEKLERVNTGQASIYFQSHAWEREKIARKLNAYIGEFYANNL